VFDAVGAAGRGCYPGVKGTSCADLPGRERSKRRHTHGCVLWSVRSRKGLETFTTLPQGREMRMEAEERRGGIT
jgi:hypothetical protein